MQTKTETPSDSRIKRVLNSILKLLFPPEDIFILILVFVLLFTPIYESWRRLKKLRQAKPGGEKNAE